MIGKDYFDVRSRLTTALKELGQLAQDTGGEPQQLAVTENLVHSLKDPFVFVITGEVNVGKSTLLNALFGEEFCRTGFMPTTDKIHYFKHGAKLRRVAISETLEEVYAPAQFLRDFHVVDTPGTNSVESNHQEITERFMPSADMVIFVFSAMNPWGATAWQFLEKVHRQWMRNVVFVLQQCDLRAPEEVEAIQTYMKQLCRQRFGREFALFPVSGKKAFLARSSGLDRERLLDESGFNKLEEYISRSIGSAGSRLGKLGMALRIAQDILGSLRMLIGGRDLGYDERKRVLKGLEHSLSSVQARTMAKLSPAMEATENDFDRATDELLVTLREHHLPAAALKNIFSRSFPSPQELENKLFEEVNRPGARRWKQTAVVIEDDVERAATQFERTVRGGLQAEVPQDGLVPGREFWSKHKERFQDRLQDMQKELVQGLKLEETLVPAWKQAGSLALWSVLLMLLGLGGGAALGWYVQAAAGIAVAAFGFVIGMILWMKSAGVLNDLTKALLAKLSAARKQLREKLEESVNNELRLVYKHFEGVMEPARHQLSEQEEWQSGLQKRVKDLEEKLEQLTQDHKGLASAGRKE